MDNPRRACGIDSPRPATSPLRAVAGGLLFAMMTLTFVDVVLRYFFNAPIKGGFEVTELMMAVLIFAGLPLVSRKNEHVTIDAFDRFFPARVRARPARRHPPGVRRHPGRHGAGSCTARPAVSPTSATSPRRSSSRSRLSST